jgi:hypothetical protein
MSGTIDHDGRSNRTIQAAAVLGYVAAGVHVLRWCILPRKLCGVKTSVWEAIEATSTAPARGCGGYTLKGLAWTARGFAALAEVALVVFGFAIAFGAPSYTLLIRPAQAAAVGPLGYADEDVLLLHVLTGAAAATYVLARPRFIFEGQKADSADVTFNAWHYLQGDYDNQQKRMSVFASRTWFGVAMAVFVGLVTSGWYNTGWRTFMIYLSFAGGPILWGLLGSLIEMLSLTIDSCAGAARSVGVVAVLEDLEGAAAMYLSAFIFYATIQMHEARSWTDMISGGNTENVSIGSLAAGLVALHAAWAIVLRRFAPWNRSSDASSASLI